MTTRRNFLKAALVGTAGIGVSKTSAKPAPSASQVDRRTLGRTGAKVSILGLGLGSAFFKPRQNSPETAAPILERALEHGINYFDTCRGYANSEELIGPVVEKRRDEIFLVTKSKGRTYDAFMKDVETSLGNLRTDHLDLLHIWNLPKNADLDEIENGALKAVHKLLDEKVISNFGVTGHSGAGVLIDAIKRFDPDAVLTVFPCTREDNGRYEDELLPLARERNMGVIAMKTVRKAIGADLIGTDLVRYAMSLEGITTAIVGLDTEAHLVENANMASGFKPLSRTEMAAMTDDVTVTLAGVPTPWLQPGYQDGCLA